MMLIAGLFFVSLVVSTQGHLCLISPHQRGSMNDINTPGAKDCILLQKPCGGRNANTSAVGIRAEEQFVITFQKNLDHFNKANPGYFSVDITDGNMKQHHQVADSAAPPLTLYFVNATIPSSFKPGKAVISVEYVTNNPKAPPAFYQCADVNILAPM